MPDRPRSGYLKIYILLALSITGEVIGTTALSRTQHITDIRPIGLASLAYCCAFWFMSAPLRVFNAGVVYAMWSGAGIVLITIINWFSFDQKLDWAALIGITMITIGVIIINILSNTLQRPSGTDRAEKKAVVRPE